jgi:hypothetical protein
MITPALFKIKFPEFMGESSARIQLFLDESLLILNEAFWGNKYDLGLYYLTAHFLSIAKQSNAGNTKSSGQVSSKSVDGASVSYNVAPLANQSESYFSSTIYGQRYISLRNKLGLVAYVI